MRTLWKRAILHTKKVRVGSSEKSHVRPVKGLWISLVPTSCFFQSRKCLFLGSWDLPCRCGRCSVKEAKLLLPLLRELCSWKKQEEMILPLYQSLLSHMAITQHLFTGTIVPNCKDVNNSLLKDRLKYTSMQHTKQPFPTLEKTGGWEGKTRKVKGCQCCRIQPCNLPGTDRNLVPDQY